MLAGHPSQEPVPLSEPTTPTPKPNRMLTQPNEAR
jgi:hypothetical protein